MYDWARIRAEYEAGGTSYRKLAEKYNIHRSTIEKRAKVEGWVKTREEISGEILAKTRQKIITKYVNRNERHLALADRALDAIEEYLAKGHYKRHVTKVKRYDKRHDAVVEELKAIKLTVADTAGLANVARTLQRMQQAHRLAEGLDLDVDKERQELERARLELLRQKLSSGTAAGDVIANNNERVMRLADMLNNPVPDRKVQDFEDEQ